jgi:hypothetical protein
VIAAVSEGFEFFNIVFFAVLLSTLLQGATFEPFARRLGLTTTPEDQRAAVPLMGRLRSTAQVSTSRPLASDDDDPAYPRQVDGIPVTRQLLTRVDRAGALVSLDDGRYAFTGRIVCVGSTSGLQAAARRRLAASTSEADRVWWREVIGALARGER